MDSLTSSGTPVYTNSPQVGGLAIAGRNLPQVAPDGKPIPKFLLPHIETFAGIVGGLSTYRWRFDEALRHSSTNALAMRRDTFIDACLQERYLAVAQQSWDVVPEDPADPEQVQQALLERRRIDDIPDLESLVVGCLEMVWYGRSAVHKMYREGPLGMVVGDHYPINGDKLVFTYEGVPAVLCHATATLPKEAEVVWTERNRAMLLRQPYFREQFIIAQHQKVDADFYEPDMAGQRFGTGKRGYVYWYWWLWQEVMGWIIDYVEKVGLGVTVFYYEQGNKDAEEAAKEAAKQHNRHTVLVLPRPPGQERATSAVERIEVPTAGAEFLLKIVESYFQDTIRLCINGQMLSARAESTGMGSGVADLHSLTKSNITLSDSRRIEDVLTRDLVGVSQRWNNPLGSRRYKLKFSYARHRPDADHLIAAARAIFDMGGIIPEKQLMEAVNLTSAKEGERTLQRLDPTVNPDVYQQQMQAQAQQAQGEAQAAQVEAQAESREKSRDRAHEARQNDLNRDHEMEKERLKAEAAKAKARSASPQKNAKEGAQRYAADDSGMHPDSGGKPGYHGYAFEGDTGYAYYNFGHHVGHKNFITGGHPDYLNNLKGLASERASNYADSLDSESGADMKALRVKRIDKDLHDYNGDIHKMAASSLGHHGFDAKSAIAGAKQIRDSMSGERQKLLDYLGTSQEYEGSRKAIESYLHGAIDRAKYPGFDWHMAADYHDDLGEAERAEEIRKHLDAGVIPPGSLPDFNKDAGGVVKGDDRTNIGRPMPPGQYGRVPGNTSLVGDELLRILALKAKASSSKDDLVREAMRIAPDLQTAMKLVELVLVRSPWLFARFELDSNTPAGQDIEKAGRLPEPRGAGSAPRTPSVPAAELSTTNTGSAAPKPEEVSSTLPTTAPAVGAPAPSLSAPAKAATTSKPLNLTYNEAFEQHITDVLRRAGHGPEKLVDFRKALPEDLHKDLKRIVGRVFDKYHIEDESARDDAVQDLWLEFGDHAKDWNPKDPQELAKLWADYARKGANRKRKGEESALGTSQLGGGGTRIQKMTSEEFEESLGSEEEEVDDAQMDEYRRLSAASEGKHPPELLYAIARYVGKYPASGIREITKDIRRQASKEKGGESWSTRQVGNAINFLNKESAKIASARQAELRAEGGATPEEIEAAGKPGFSYMPPEVVVPWRDAKDLSRNFTHSELTDEQKVLRAALRARERSLNTSSKGDYKASELLDTLKYTGLKTADVKEILQDLVDQGHLERPSFLKAPESGGVSEQQAVSGKSWDPSVFGDGGPAGNKVDAALGDLMPSGQAPAPLQAKAESPLREGWSQHNHDTYSHLKGLVLKNHQGASPEKQARYEEILSTVAGNASPTSAWLMRQNVKDFVYHDSSEPLLAAYADALKDDGKPEQEIQSRLEAYRQTGTSPGGFYNPHKRSVHVGAWGDKEAPSHRQLTGYPNDIQTTAHELGHATDLGERYSRIPDWRDAWRKDILVGRALGDYAGSQPWEGFAEAMRAVQTFPDHDTLWARMPNVMAFLDEYGLLAEQHLKAAPKGYVSKRRL